MLRSFVMFLLFVVVFPVNAFDYFQIKPESPIIPQDNLQTREKIELGKMLFFDPRLSKDLSVSCNGCHNLLLSGVDGKQLSSGVGNLKTKRNAPSLWDAAYQTVYYWDGRATSLENLLHEHLLNPVVTGMQDQKAFLQRIESIIDYDVQFEHAFPNNGLTFVNVSKSISAFLRTLNTTISPYDRYLTGDQDAISKAAIRGKDAFNEIECSACHFGINLAGPAPGPAIKMGMGFYELFPNYLGTHYDKKYHLVDDLGLYLSSHVETDRHMWRVPPLRNVARTAPYFHNGEVKSLDEAIKIMAKVQKGRELSSQQVSDLSAFLQSLSGGYPEITMPRLPGLSSYVSVKK